MYRGADVHHYRVEGADGVLYLCPPHWLPEHPLEAARKDQMSKEIGELIAKWDARRAGISLLPEDVA